MFSGLQKLFDRAFIIGFFIPALLFVLAVQEVFGRRPVLEAIVDGTETGTVLTGVALTLLFVWVIALLLVTANYFFYRLLEGYLRPVSSLRSLKLRQLKQFNALQKQKDSADDKCYARALLASRTQFPPSESEVMPTAFGNAIRAFETYPRDTYGVDAISIWLRLISVLPKDFRDQIGDGRSHVDFFVNICFLSGVVFISCIARLLTRVGELLVQPQVFSAYSKLALEAFYTTETVSAIAIVAAAVSAVVSYYFATLLVPQWGELVKSAFDCYLPSLANQLGYTLPETDVERRRFWTEFSQLVLYGNEFNPAAWQQTASRTTEGNRCFGANP